jgi:type IV pilus assembly protein PilM
MRLWAVGTLASLPAQLICVQRRRPIVLSSLLAHESAIGVDIGSSSIKIVQAEPTKQGIRISRVATCPTPLESVKEGVVVNVPEVAAAIQFAMRSAGIKASSAVTAITGPGVVVRNVQIPRMTEQVFRKSMAFEAGKYIPASVEDSVVEFELLGDAGDGQMSALLVAAPRPIVDSKVAAIEQAGLDPVAVDVEAFATFRTLVEYGGDPSLLEGTIALLDVGSSHTEINLVCSGKLELTRTIPIAGNSLTNAIKNAENCTEDEAEQKKHEYDLGELVGMPAGSASTPGLKVLQSLVDEMLREVRRSVTYYQSQLPDGAAEISVSRLIFTGGSSRLTGLLPYAGSRLNVEVSAGSQVLSGLLNMSRAQVELSEDDAPLFAVAFGLAVKETGAVRMAEAA